MSFGPMTLDQAKGGVLAHSLSTPDGRIRKGSRIDGPVLRRLRAAGYQEVVAGLPEDGDVPEDAAAALVAAALVADGIEARAPFTGRCNLHATGPGVLDVSRPKIDALNRLTDDVTVATLPEWQRVTAGMMVATVKIISFFANEHAFADRLEAAEGALRLHRPVIDLAELIVTKLDGAPEKTAPVLARLDRLGIAHHVTEVPHETGALTTALERGQAPLRLILTASATCDPRDVGPAALVAAGGMLTRFGMPVDPGNLLFLGDLGPAKVIGLPGCARSPALNGADWVLERIACGLEVSHADIAGMGVGGLLNEIPTRPQPREKR
ncbi:MAG: molybdopterin-binding protein [Pseudomonadota bacterium]